MPIEKPANNPIKKHLETSGEGEKISPEKAVSEVNSLLNEVYSKKKYAEQLNEDAVFQNEVQTFLWTAASGNLEGRAGQKFNISEFNIDAEKGLDKREFKLFCDSLNEGIEALIETGNLENFTSSNESVSRLEDMSGINPESKEGRALLHSKWGDEKFLGGIKFAAQKEGIENIESFWMLLKDAPMGVLKAPTYLGARALPFFGNEEKANQMSQENALIGLLHSMTTIEGLSTMVKEIYKEFKTMVSGTAEGAVKALITIIGMVGGATATRFGIKHGVKNSLKKGINKAGKAINKTKKVGKNISNNVSKKLEKVMFDNEVKSEIARRLRPGEVGSVNLNPNYTPPKYDIRGYEQSLDITKQNPQLTQAISDNLNNIKHRDAVLQETRQRLSSQISQQQTLSKNSPNQHKVVNMGNDGMQMHVPRKGTYAAQVQTLSRELDKVNGELNKIHHSIKSSEDLLRRSQIAGTPNGIQTEISGLKSQLDNIEDRAQFKDPAWKKNYKIEKDNLRTRIAKLENLRNKKDVISLKNEKQTLKTKQRSLEKEIEEGDKLLKDLGLFDIAEKRRIKKIQNGIKKELNDVKLELSDVKEDIMIIERQVNQFDSANAIKQKPRETVSATKNKKTPIDNLQDTPFQKEIDNLSTNDIIISHSGTQRKVTAINGDDVHVLTTAKNGNITKQVLSRKTDFGNKKWIAEIKKEKTPELSHKAVDNLQDTPFQKEIESLSTNDIIVSHSGTQRKVTAVTGDDVHVLTTAKNGNITKQVLSRKTDFTHKKLFITDINNFLWSEVWIFE